MSLSSSLLWTGAATGLLALVATGCARTDAAVADPSIARGRYLVHQVAMCVDCHSPRGERGAFIETEHLKGAALPFAPTVPMPAWAQAAPPIAGLPPGYSETEHVEFLMTGKRPDGRPPAMPPMPEFRMNRADATAVTAYLRSLAPAAP